MPQMIHALNDSSDSHLVLPASRVSLHTVMLPMTAPHRLQAALAGALEENLLDDAADLHFALAPNAAAAMKAGQPFEVMACDKAWLKSQCDKWQASGRRITAIVPESPALQAAGWNLAQFDFRVQSRLSSRLQATIHALWQGPDWRAARLALVVLLLVHIVGLNVWALLDRAALSAKREQLKNILTQTFPETPVVIDAPQQMTRAVAALRATSGNLSAKDLEPQLAEQATQNQALTQVTYDQGTLTVSSKVTP